MGAMKTMASVGRMTAKARTRASRETKDMEK